MDNYDIIERPSKRRHISHQSRDRDLHEKRRSNDLRLKSRFESIFEKYGKDFTETADEIDLETGQIVVNKGHLLAMADETDTGHTLPSNGPQHTDYWTAAEEEDGQQTDHLEREENEDEEEAASSSADELNRESNDSGANLARDRVIATKHVLHSTSHRPQVPNPRAEKLHYRHHVQVPHSLKSPPTDSHPHDAETKIPSPCAGRRFISMNAPAIEPAWQAPPLPTDGRHNTHPPAIASLESGETSRKRCPSPLQGSLWASGRKRGRPRTWTREEDDLLRHLKTNTDYTYLELQHYFPGRSRIGIAFHWTQELSGRRKNRRHSWDSTIESPPLTRTGEVPKMSYRECSPSAQSKRCKPLVVKSLAPIPSTIDSEDLQGKNEQRKTSSQSPHVGAEKHKKQLPDVHIRETSARNTRKRTFSVSGLQTGLSYTQASPDSSSANDAQPAKRRYTHLSHTCRPQPEKMKPDAPTISVKHENPPSKGTSDNYASISGVSIRAKDSGTAANRKDSACSVLPKQQSVGMASSLTPKALTLSSPGPSKLNPKMSKSFGINSPRSKTEIQSRSLTTVPSEVAKHSPSDSCELALNYTCNASSATPKQASYGEAKTPLLRRSGKKTIRNGGDGTTPQSTRIDEGSEDELSTPIKTVGASENLLGKAVGSKRRKMTF